MYIYIYIYIDGVSIRTKSFDSKEDLLAYAKSPKKQIKGDEDQIPIGFEIINEKDGKYEYEIFVDRYEFPKVSENYINSLATYIYIYIYIYIVVPMHRNTRI